MRMILTTLAAISLSLLILFNALFFVMDWKPFYAYEIEKNDISQVVDIDEEALLPLYMVLTDYMKGHRDSIQIQATVAGVEMPMYNQREMDHMVDVKHLIDLVKNICFALLIVLGLSLFYLIRKRHGLRGLFLGQFLSTIAIFLVFIAMATMDFNAYFIKFHEMLFSNDLWLLDPTRDRMIQLLPEVFFRDMVLVIVLAYGFVSLFLGLVASMVNRKYMSR